MPSAEPVQEGLANTEKEVDGVPQTESCNNLEQVRIVNSNSIAQENTAFFGLNKSPRGTADFSAASFTNGNQLDLA